MVIERAAWSISVAIRNHELAKVLTGRSARLGYLGAIMRDHSRSGFRYHLKVHSFRTLMVILAWVFLALAFYQDPEALIGAQR
jgi:hypothetical protein